MQHLFEILVALHIVAGAVGALVMWVPVLGRKGGDQHRRWGRVFVVALVVTGVLAVGMSLLTLADPLGTHPHLADRLDAGFVAGLFGWMMLHNAVLTINLCWYGWLCVRAKRDHVRQRHPRNLATHAALALAAVACAGHGLALGEPLMIGMSLVGFATVGTNLRFVFKATRSPVDWQKEHLKALVGGGISVYTAFLAFGSVRLVPELALNPWMWSVPLLAGVVTILYHWRRLDRRVTPRSLAVGGARV